MNKEEEKEIIVIICEDEKFFADITKKYVNDINGDYKGAITLMARFPESERPKIAEFLMKK